MRIMENEVRLVMMDIDGTIVNSPHNRSVTKELCETVRLVAERGILIGLASGRNYGHVISQMGDIGFTGPYICNNGAYVVMDGQIYREVLLTDDIIDAAWKQAKELHCYIEFSGRNVMHTCELPGYTGLTFPKVGPGNYLDIMEYDAHIPERMHKEYISKITLVVNTKEKAAEIERFWRFGELKEEVYLSNSFWYCLEITRKGVCKGEGLLAVAKRLGIPMEKVLAVGDGDNDAEMLKAAGISFAMGNASKAALAAAKYRAAPVTEDGARKVLEQYVLNYTAPNYPG